MLATLVLLHYTLTPEVRDGRLVLHVSAEMPKGTELVRPQDRGVIDFKSDNGRVSYDLINDWQGPLRDSVRHRRHLEPTYIEINTSNALVYPKLPLSARVDCTFEWKLPAGWTIATSFGSGETRQRFRGAWDSVQNAVYIGGDFRIHRSKIGKGNFFFAIRGKWSFSDEEASAQIANIIRVQRAFWKDDNFPYYLVTMVPFELDEGFTGGSGFTNAFSLHTSPRNSFSYPLLSLLSHEASHSWNPYKLGRMPDPAESVYWFTEGFQTYYQDIFLRRAGLLTFDGYIESVNRYLRDYHLSPQKNASLAELIATGVKNRISYERGAATALWLDWKIRQRSGAKSSLDSLMFDLFREGRKLPELNRERVFRAASRYLSPEDVAQFRAYVEQGVTVEAPADAFGACAVREMVDIPSFELGMNREELLEKRRVAGLQPASEAYKSGLRDGDIVVGTDVYWNDTSKPVKLTVQRGKTRATFEYFPRGASAGMVPKYVALRRESCLP